MSILPTSYCEKERSAVPIPSLSLRSRKRGRFRKDRGRLLPVTILLKKGGERFGFPYITGERKEKRAVRKEAVRPPGERGGIIVNVEGRGKKDRRKLRRLQCLAVGKGSVAL